VLSPTKGLHKEFVVTLDFRSLYPSIMIAHNLCMSTEITDEQASNMPPDDWEQAPDGIAAKFVRRNVFEGVAPRALSILLKARGEAKRAMAAAYKSGNIAMGDVLNARQLALKITANSIYGTFGFVQSALHWRHVSETVTAYGREAIDLSKRVIEKEIQKWSREDVMKILENPKENYLLKDEKYQKFLNDVNVMKFPLPSARVIYGDTVNMLFLFFVLCLCLFDIGFSDDYFRWCRQSKGCRIARQSLCCNREYTLY
jgi:DNA polymerase elongation subunit (family B)